MPETWSGRQIGDFVVEERIARGGLSTIYRARQVSVNRFVALKLIDLGDDIFDRDAFRRDFEREVATTATLEHIHIIPVYGFGVLDDRYAYIAMRLLSGGSLLDVMKDTPLSIERVTDLLNDIAQALDYAHRKGVLHGDLKPSNILLDNSGRAYLSDFGVASVIASAIDPLVSQSLNHLPLYVAPERLRGEEGDARADIYSMGAILYHLLTGRPPFELDEGGLGDLMYRQLEQDALPPRTFNQDIAPGIDGLIMRALRKNPGDRFANVTDMTRAFSTALGRSSLEWKMNPLTVSPRSPRRWLWLIPAIIGVLAVVGVFVLSRQPAYSGTQPPIIIHAGEIGTLENVEPSQGDMDRARAVLGDDGFIAYLNCSLDNVLFASRSRYTREIAEGLGLRIVVYDANNDLYTQLTQIEQARLEGAAAIILCPTASSGFEESAARLQAANIPLIWATLVEGIYGVKLDSDNYAIGQRLGETAGQIFTEEFGGQAEYVIIHRGPFPASLQRKDGILEALARMAPQSELVAEIAAGNRDLLEAAETDLSAVLEEGIAFDAILCVADSCAYGATNALTNAGVSPDDVFILSAGAEPFALDLLRADSYLRGTLAIDREIAARLMLYAAIDMLAGKPIPEYLSFPPGEMITEANVEVYDSD